MIDFKQLRKQNKYTLRQVEEKTGISNAYLSQLENGKIKKPSFDVVIKLNKLYKAEEIALPTEFIDWLGDNYLKLHGPIFSMRHVMSMVIGEQHQQGITISVSRN